MLLCWTSNQFNGSASVLTLFCCQSPINGRCLFCVGLLLWSFDHVSQYKAHLGFWACYYLKNNNSAFKFFQKSHLLPSTCPCFHSFPLKGCSRLAQEAVLAHLTVLSTVQESLPICVNVSLCFSGSLTPRPKLTWPCGACPIIHHAFEPIALAEPLLMGSFLTRLKKQTLLSVPCVHCREDVCSLCMAVGPSWNSKWTQ